MRVETIGNATLYLGDCREIIAGIQADALVTDPPYPNGEGHFVGAIGAAESVVLKPSCDEAIIFWSERKPPIVLLPLIAVHIWHRTNVNGKVYEPAYHYALDGKLRRSEIKAHAAVFDGVGPGCAEYAGHPTQKPIAVMEWLVAKTSGVVMDPFMGSGSTGVACAKLRRPFIGVEEKPEFFEIARERIENAQRQERLFA